MAAVRNRKWRLATRLRLATAEVANGKVSASETPVPVWVINLDKSVDRWEQCLKEFATEHVHAERFPATYGKTLPKDELKEKVTFGCRYFCTPGMIGCFLSHRRIWERALSEGHAAVVALEDDVVLYPNFNKRLTSILSELPPDWDVCLLGAVGGIATDKESLAMRIFSMCVGGSRSSPGRTRGVSQNIYVPFKPAGTHGYLVSRKGAAKLLEQLPRARYHVDLSAWSLQDLRLYAAKDFLVTQRFDAPSTVSEEKPSPTLQRLLRWPLEVTGLTALTRSGGAPTAWTWRVALFALPVPLTGRRIIVELGPAASVFVLLCMLALALRSWNVAALALVYQAFLVLMMRWLAGTWSFRGALVYIFLTDLCLRLGKLSKLALLMAKTRHTDVAFVATEMSKAVL